MRGHSDRSNDRVDEAMGQYAGWNTISYGNIIILNILEEILCNYHEIFLWPLFFLIVTLCRRSLMTV